MDTYYFSATEEIDDPDEPVPDEDHTEDDDNDEDESVVPGDALENPPTGSSDAP